MMNGVFYVLGTGCQWRAIPKDLPPKSTVYEYLMLWSYCQKLVTVVLRTPEQ